jgi:hypothetical protein
LNFDCFVVEEGAMRLSNVGLRSRWLRSIVGSVVFASGGSLVALPGIAQTLPECAPPNASEYLLLVVNQSPETEAQLTELLPENAAISTCNYLNEEVVRVGGFANLEIANAWAQYLNDMANLQAFVARPAVASTSAIAPSPAEEPAPSAPESTAESAPEASAEADTASSFPSPTQLPAAEANSQPGANAFPTPTQVPANETSPAPAAAAAPAASNQGYNPQPLGDGYAVLVDYFSRPEVAADVRQVTSQSVGLVAYEQNPFLLAAHTADSAAANAVLQTLTERGFTAIVVESRRAVLLSPAVVGTEE